MNTTALLHEAYLKLANQSTATWHDRTHFFAVAAVAMRQIVVDYARRRQAAKRGGGTPHRVLDAWNAEAVPVAEQADALVALDRALRQLSTLDERLVRIVEMRFFGGMSVDETAQALQVSAATIKRDTRAARAFLYREMEL